MMEILLLIAIAILGGLGLLIFVGLRSGRGDLIAPPAEFGVEANERPELPRIEPDEVKLPPKEERPELAPPPPLPPKKQRPEVAKTEELLQPDGDATPKRGPRSGEPAPDQPSDADTLWQDTPKRAGTPPGKTEDAYSKEELVEREVRAMLLQNRRDRAVSHVRSELKLNTAVAEAYVMKIEAETG